MKQVCEHEGILMEVEYSEAASAEGPLIDSVRVLGDDYRATGPNLVPLLDKMVLLTGAAEGTMILSRVAESLIQ